MSRKLTVEEKRLWNRVAKTTTRGEMHFPISEKPSIKKKPKQAIAPFKIQGHSISSAPLPSPNVPQPRIDTKKLAKLKRGKLAPEARIDLHGMTQSEAHPELTQFLMNCFQRRFRMVLVITGKGKIKPDTGPIPERVGVLRQAVPRWLSVGPLSSIVQTTVESHQKHGGAGAYYVYLKRSR